MDNADKLLNEPNFPNNLPAGHYLWKLLEETLMADYEEANKEGATK